jgi:hypothetical protein
MEASRHYWPFYCEENIWHACGELPLDVGEALVAFISNPARLVAMWCQRSAHSSEEPVIWDYHVILLMRREAVWQVLDPDSTLPAPAPAARYLGASFPPLPEEWARQRPRFRLVPAADYRRELRSDRSHMRAPDGSWLREPPPGPCIGQGTNLMRFVDTEADFLGEVCDLAGLRARLGVVGLSSALATGGKKGQTREPQEQQ